MDALAFTLRLVDKMSAPARQAARALGNLEAQLKSVDRAGATLDRVQRQPAIKPMPVKSVGPASDKAKAQTDKLAAAALAKQRTADERKLAQAMRTEDRKERALVAAERKAYALADRFRRTQERDQVRAARTAEKAARAQAKALTAGSSAGPSALEGALGNLGKAGAALRAPMLLGAAGVGAVGAAALVAVAGVAALAAGIGALIVVGGKLALAAAGARKDLEITLEAMLGSQQAAARTVDGINRVTNDVAITTAKASELVSSLATAGLKNEAVLLGTVRAIGQAESVVQGAGAKLEAIIQKAQAPVAMLTPMGVQLRKVFKISPEDLQGTGVAIQDFYSELGKRIGKGTADVRFELAMGRISAEEGTKALNAAVERKLGGAAAKKALGLDNQLRRLSESFRKLFEGVRIEGALKSFKAFADIFDQSTVSGTALKVLMEQIFNPLFDTIGRLAPYVKTFMKGLIIIGLQVYIGFKPLLRAIGAIGKDGASDQESLAERMSKIGTVAGKAAELVSRLTLELIRLWPTLTRASEVLMMAINPLDTVTSAFGRVVNIAKDIGSRLVEAVPKWIEAGKNLVKGLIDGVTSAGADLIASVTSLGDKALAAFKAKFQIASPSRVTMGFGANISMGLAQGIKSKANVANDTMAKVIPIAPFLRRQAPVVAPPRAVGAGQGPGATGARGKGDTNFTLNVDKDGINIRIDGGGDPQQIRAMMPEILADAFEQFAESQGVDKESAA